MGDGMFEVSNRSIEPLKFTKADTEFEEYIRQARKKLARVLGVPSYIQVKELRERGRENESVGD